AGVIPAAPFLDRRSNMIQQAQKQIEPDEVATVLHISMEEPIRCAVAEHGKPAKWEQWGHEEDIYKFERTGDTCCDLVIDASICLADPRQAPTIDPYFTVQIRGAIGFFEFECKLTEIVQRDGKLFLNYYVQGC